MTIFAAIGIFATFIMLGYFTFGLIVVWFGLLALSNGGSVSERFYITFFTGLIGYFWYLFFTNLPIQIVT